MRPTPARASWTVFVIAAAAELAWLAMLAWLAWRS
jgi:hypothetical protein